MGNQVNAVVDIINRTGYYEHIYDNGDIYKGNFKNGKRHGRGVYITESGSSYEGSWINDKREGIGSQIYKAKTISNDIDNNNVFSINVDRFTDYQKTDANKSSDQFHWVGSYDGEWKDNKKFGHGIYVYSDTGDVYDGQWINGKKHGYGVYTYGRNNNESGSKNSTALLDRYEGEFKLDCMDGAGTLIIPIDNEKITGYYKSDKKNGRFCYYNKEGKLYKEEWYENDSLLSVSEPPPNSEIKEKNIR